MKPDITLIISIYNKIDMLELVLLSLENQNFNNFEVVLSDDGSNKESVDRIEKLKRDYSFPIKHIWHPDMGWKKNRILNKSILVSDSDYLVFIDGDCLLHPNFIQEHNLSKLANTVLAGRRVNLSKRITNKLSEELIKNNYLNRGVIIDSFWDSIWSKAKDAEQGVFIRSPRIRKFLNRKDKGILGSNFSVSKQDLLNVNGFDERFLYPAAGEDTDIEARFRRNGLLIKTIRNQAIQYHLHHNQLPRSKERLKYLDENNANNVTFTPFGINKNA